MLVRSKDIIDLEMVRLMAAQNMFHDFTRDACQGDWPIVIWQGFIILLKNRGNKCLLPLLREVASYKRLSKDHLQYLSTLWGEGLLLFSF